MADFELIKTRIHAGKWEGIVTTPNEEAFAPDLDVTHLGNPIDGVEVKADPDQLGRFSVSIPIPSDLLFDGIQTFLISDRESGDLLDSFTILAGEPLDDEFRSEINLLREELDMLKRAFRRHCLETR